MAIPRMRDSYRVPDDSSSGAGVGARCYDAQIGRPGFARVPAQFITRDTVLSEHPYLYCEHDAVNAVDPSGRFGLWQGVGAVGVALIAGGAIAVTGGTAVIIIGGAIGGGAIGAVIGGEFDRGAARDPVSTRLVNGSMIGMVIGIGLWGGGIHPLPPGPRLAPACLSVGTTW